MACDPKNCNVKNGRKIPCPAECLERLKTPSLKDLCDMMSRVEYLYSLKNEMHALMNKGKDTAVVKLYIKITEVAKEIVDAS